MKLLILTQKIDRNDSVLGFFHRWVEEFAKHYEQVTVICLQKGEHALPSNVRVFSLGKEEKVSKLRYVYHFYRHIWRERKNYDTVFVHMNPEYVVLGGWLWRLWGKRVGLWYAHGHVPRMLRVAERLAHVIFTSTKSGFRLPSRKLKIVGQGIDTEHFSPLQKKDKNEVVNIITVGRISPVKDYETLIAAIDILHKQGQLLSVTIVGAPGTDEQEEYENTLKEIVANNGLSGVITFLGPVPNRELPKQLQPADIFVNTSHTGSLDKAMLEAMACGVIPVTCNEAMEDVLGEYKKQLMFAKKNAEELAQCINLVAKMDVNGQNKLAKEMRNIVVQQHGLASFVKKIVSYI